MERSSPAGDAPWGLLILFACAGYEYTITYTQSKSLNAPSSKSCRMTGHVRSRRRNQDHHTPCKGCPAQALPSLRHNKSATQPLKVPIDKPTTT